MIITQSKVNLISLLLISIGLIIAGGSFLYLHNMYPLYERNPIYWGLAFMLISNGYSIFTKILLKNIIPTKLVENIQK